MIIGQRFALRDFPSQAKGHPVMALRSRVWFDGQL